MTNKLERKIKGFFKFKKRLLNYGLKQEKPTEYYIFKTTGKPCSCYMCSGLKHSRKQKHKLKNYEN